MVSAMEDTCRDKRRTNRSLKASMNLKYFRQIVEIVVFTDAEAIYWTNSETFGEYESFPPQNM